MQGVIPDVVGRGRKVLKAVPQSRCLVTELLKYDPHACSLALREAEGICRDSTVSLVPYLGVLLQSGSASIISFLINILLG